MRRNFLLILIFLFTALGCIWAETQTIVLVSVVNKTYPQFTLRNNETNETGESLTYNSSRIHRENVSVGFDIVQTNQSNYKGSVDFHISCTRLIANIDGKTYATDEATILVGSKNYIGSADFEKAYDSNIQVGQTIESFNVTWQTSDALEKATYQALITLSFSAN